jgi:CRP-like cAMP-binding protein
MLIEDLSKFEVFQDLDDLELRKLLQFGRFKRFETNAVLFSEGNLGAGVLIVLTGKLELFRKHQDAELVLDELMPGEFLGEDTLFGEVRQWRFSVRAVEDTKILWINTLEYRRFLSSGAAVLTKLLLRLVILLSGTFREKNQEYGSMAMMKSEH